MTFVRTMENSILDKANSILEEIVNKYGTEYKQKALVMAACKIAGYEYNSSIGTIIINAQDKEMIMPYIKYLVNELNRTMIEPTLAICSLCRENISYVEKKQRGVYYTDYRLALYLSENICEKIKCDNTIIDTASGTGILLMAVALKCKDKWNNEDFINWLNECIYACDISEQALLGINIAALTLVKTDLEIKKLQSHLYKFDSLIEKIPNDRKFDFVVGNPPWGKIKLTRHMFSAEQGIEHTYGDNYQVYDSKKYEESKDVLTQYSNLIREKYSLCEKGEIDLYMPFLELAMSIVKKSGMISLIIPAGLIRSQGTEKLRKNIFSKYSYIKISVMDNRDKFFTIDTRFKYLVVSFRNEGNEKGIFVNKPFVERGLINDSNGIVLTKEELKYLREDYSIPETFTNIELDIFKKMITNGVLCDENPEWKMDIVREVDMTTFANKFIKNSKKGVPIIEGRMIHNFRTGAKNYVSGQGRSAKWSINSYGKATIKPQYTILEQDLPTSILERLRVERAGFCDIAGQTNERGMMASLIPSGVVCGNKVPTITFVNDNSTDRLLLWIGIVNSFSFDWFLRRVLTTTVNFFLLKSIPLPNIIITSNEAKIIIENTRNLIDKDKASISLNEMESMRASIDIAVAKAYGLDKKDLENILLDFPLLDRGQPCINGEAKSTVTKDCILMNIKGNEDYQVNARRYKEAKELGAFAYINAEVQKGMVDIDE